MICAVQVFLRIAKLTNLSTDNLEITLRVSQHNICFGKKKGIYWVSLMFVYKKNLLLIKLGELIGQKSIKYDVATMYNYTVMALLM